MSSEKQSSNPDFYSVIGRALVDSEFRELLRDPERRKEALYAMNVEPTDEVMQELDNTTAAIERLSASFGGGQAAS
jgi:hypothetical protein